MAFDSTHCLVKVKGSGVNGLICSLVDLWYEAEKASGNVC